MDERPKSMAPVLVLFGILAPVLMLGTYAAGYFALPKRHPHHRQFDERWQAEIFKPAAKIEGFLTGQQIDTCSG